VTLYFNIQYSSSLSVVVKSEVTVMAKRYGPRGRMSCTKLLSQYEYTKLNKKKTKKFKDFRKDFCNRLDKCFGECIDGWINSCITTYNMYFPCLMYL